MSFTNTKRRTLRAALDASTMDELTSALRRLKMGTRETLLKRTFTGLAGAATYDLTALDATTEAPQEDDLTYSGVANPNRLPAKHVRTLRVTAATTANTVGPYIVVDSGGATLTPTAGANVGVAKISDDGSTLTFPSADVTAFIIEYTPAGRADGGAGTPWPEALSNLAPLG